MDLEGFWQENKRFLTGVAAGVLAFGIGWTLIDRFYGADLSAQLRAANAAATRLRSEALFGPGDMERAEREHAALTEAVARLSEAVAFRPRPAFALDEQKGSSGREYFAAVSATREQLLTLTGRANLRLPEGLGLPALSPTREAEIVRYLAGLDLVDRAVRLALEAGVERIDRIDIKLDPGLSSRQGVGSIERTRVEFVLSGRPGPLVRFLQATQEAAGAGPLLIDKADMAPARNKPDEAGLEVVFVAARVAHREAERNR